MSGSSNRFVHGLMILSVVVLSSCGGGSDGDSPVLSPSLSIDSPSVIEGNTGNVDMVFTVTLSEAATSTLTVDYVTSDDTATVADGDYIAISGTATIAQGSDSVNINVPVNGDASIEADETFNLVFSNPQGMQIDNSSSAFTGQGTISNDDFIERISVNSNGEGGNSSSYRPVISADNRYVAFESIATNLVSDDTNNVQDIFVRDTHTDTITRISVDSAGIEGNGVSRDPSISGDGRYVVYRSAASNLISDDSNATDDIFMRDLVNNSTVRVSIASGVNGAEGDGRSSTPTISAEGGYVAFASSASNLSTNDTNNTNDIFVRDLANSTTTRISLATGINGAEGNDFSVNPVISNNGLFVAFLSNASNFVADDTNGTQDVFVRDIMNNTTIRVNIASGINGAEADRESLQVSMSADGNFVAYATAATTLVSNDTNNSADVYLRDINANTTTRISVDSIGVEGNNTSSLPSISADARYISFGSTASNLVTNDSNNFQDVFVHDRQTGETRRVSVDTTGVEGNDKSGFPKITISADGQFVAFSSDASNLVANDLEMQTDIFRVLIR